MSLYKEYIDYQISDECYIESTETVHNENRWLEMIIDERSYILGAICRHPNHGIYEFENTLEIVMEKILYNCRSHKYGPIVATFFSDITDHLPCFLIIKYNTNQTVEIFNRSKVGSFSKANITKFTQELGKIEWGEILYT